MGQQAYSRKMEPREPTFVCVRCRGERARPARSTCEPSQRSARRLGEQRSGVPEDASLLVFKIKVACGWAECEDLNKDRRGRRSFDKYKRNIHCGRHTSPYHRGPEFDSSREKILEDPTQIQTPNRKKIRILGEEGKHCFPAQDAASLPPSIQQKTAQYRQTTPPRSSKFCMCVFFKFFPSVILPSLRSLIVNTL